MALSKPQLLQTLISFVVLFVMLANKVHSDDVTTFTVDMFNPRPDFLHYAGDAHVPSGSQSLRLTQTDDNGNALGNSVGLVLYNQPMQFWESQPSLRQSSFETTIRFQITPPPNNEPADGMVFFIAPLNFFVPPGSSGGNFGIFNPSTGRSPNLFAIEFDTYVNGAWDPQFRHLGIDLESRMSVNTTRFSDDMLGREVTVRINYEQNTRMITAVASAGSERVEVKYNYDLKSILNERCLLGIAASTGGNTAVHDLRSWYFTSTLLYDREARSNCANEHRYIRQFV